MNVVELLHLYAYHNYQDHIKSLGVSLGMADLPGDNFLQKVISLCEGVQAFEKLYGGKLIEDNGMPFFFDQRYQVVEFDLNMSACKLDMEDKLMLL